LLLHTLPTVMGEIFLLMDSSMLIYSGFCHPLDGNPRLSADLRDHLAKQLRCSDRAVLNVSKYDLPLYPSLQTAVEQFDAYFQGRLQEFNLPVQFYGTGFQQLVWGRLLKIPCGETITYGQIASEIGRHRSVRAVGSAVGTNPLSIIVPCHRVLPASGGIGNYGGGIERKEALLRIEGFAGKSA